MTTPQVEPPRADAPVPEGSGHRSDTSTRLSKSLLPSRDSTPQEREAILAGLYEQLHALNQQRRAGTLSAMELASLRDVKAEIDRWELEERRLAQKPEVASRLEALAERVLRLAGSGA